MTQEQGWDEHNEHVDEPSREPVRYEIGDLVRWWTGSGEKSGEIRARSSRGGEPGYNIRPQGGNMAEWVREQDVLGFTVEPETAQDAFAIMKQTGSRDSHAFLLASQVLWLVAREVSPTASAAARIAARDMRREVYALLEGLIAQGNGGPRVADGEQMPVSEANNHLRETLGAIKLAFNAYPDITKMPQATYDAIQRRLLYVSALQAAIYAGGRGNPDFPHVVVTVHVV